MFSLIYTRIMQEEVGWCWLAVGALEAQEGNWGEEALKVPLGGSLCLGDQPEHIGEGRKATFSPGLVLGGGICYSMAEG